MAVASLSSFSRTPHAHSLRLKRFLHVFVRPLSFLLPKGIRLLLRCSVCMGLCLLDISVAQPLLVRSASQSFNLSGGKIGVERSLAWGRRWLPPSASRKASVRDPKHAHDHIVALSRTSLNSFLMVRVLRCFAVVALSFAQFRALHHR